jgi:oligosaccharide repeat unit polymerase
MRVKTLPRPSRSNNVFKLIPPFIVVVYCVLSFFVSWAMVAGVILIITTIYLCFYFNSKYHDWLNPATIHTAVWLGFLGVSFFGQSIVDSTYSGFSFEKIFLGHNQITLKSLAVIIGAYLLFMTGVLIGTWRIRRSSVPPSFSVIILSEYRLNRLRLITILFFLIGASVFAFFFFLSGWKIPLLTGISGGEFGHIVNIPVFGYLEKLIRFALVLGSFYILLQYQQVGKLPLLMTALVLLSLVLTITHGQRSEVFVSMLIVIFGAHYILGEKSKRKFLLFVGVVLSIIFFLIPFTRSGKDHFDSAKDLALFAYLDTAASFGNLTFVLEQHEPYYEPANTLLMLDPFLGRSLVPLSRERVYEVFRAGLISTYLTDIYYDYGYWGVFILPLLLGVGTGLTYAFWITQPTLFSFFLFAVFAVSNVMTFRTFRYTATPEIVFYPVMAYWVDLTCRGQVDKRRLLIFYFLLLFILLLFAMANLE